jgi:predicted TIM-barrel fold metal-dependent hydrolase
MAGAIDIVCNLYTPQVVADGQTGLDDDFKEQVRMPEYMRDGVAIEDYIGKMDKAGIESSLLIDCHRGMQGLYDLEEAVKEYGFVGAHLYPHWCELPPDHAKYYPYYAKCCELDIPIMMQVGHNLVYSRERRLPSVGRPITLDQVAIDFPELKLIGIHIGVPWTEEMISMCWKHENIYTAGDAYAPKYWPKEFVHYANSYGKHKVLFGTDWPVIDPERAVQEIEALGFRDDAKQMLMRDNALRVFNLPE